MSKWFAVNKENKTFISILKATTLEEGWEKTFEKWGLIVKGYNYGFLEKGGLCDLYWNDCRDCVIYKETGGEDCYEISYAFWKKNKTKANTKAELEFLKKLHKKTMGGENK